MVLPVRVLTKICILETDQRKRKGFPVAVEEDRVSIDDMRKEEVTLYREA